MPYTYFLSNGLLYAIIANAYIFILMISLSPRFWGVMDYTEEIKAKVAPQNKEEKRTAIIIGIPWLLFVFIFPLVSTYLLKMQLGNDFSLGIAFTNMFVLLVLITIGDFVVLDWWIVSTITPAYVIIPGTDKEEYKNINQHFRGHIKSFLVQTVVCMLIAVIITIL